MTYYYYQLLLTIIISWGGEGVRGGEGRLKKYSLISGKGTADNILYLFSSYLSVGLWTLKLGIGNLYKNKKLNLLF